MELDKVHKYYEAKSLNILDEQWKWVDEFKETGTCSGKKRRTGRSVAMALYGIRLLEQGRSVVWIDPLRYSPIKVDPNTVYLVDNNGLQPYVVDLTVRPDLYAPFCRLLGYEPPEERMNLEEGREDSYYLAMGIVSFGRQIEKRVGEFANFGTFAFGCSGYPDRSH
jgi:hypothetical protein